MMDSDGDAALRDGLHALPTPELADDFDARVLAALHAPRSWWRVWLGEALPMLPAAACGLVLMLALAHWSAQTPLSALSVPSSGGRVLALSPALLDRALASPRLTAGTLARLASEPAPAPPPAPPSQIDKDRPIRFGCAAWQRHGAAVA